MSRTSLPSFSASELATIPRRLPRRSMLQASGVLLSGAAVALLSGNHALAKSTKGGAADVQIVGGLEHMHHLSMSAYLGAVPIFGNRDLAKAAASILGDEAMHWAILRNALGETPVPSAFVS